LLPIGALLTAWGLLTIYRLDSSFGFRQTAWLLIVFGIMAAGLNLPPDLGFLRRYKYLWLTGSLIITGLTLFFGVNPLGYGPKMWLGCCGVYLQPSEPLKLLLIAFLAGYLADRYSFLSLSTKTKFPEILNWLAPTVMMTGLAMAILVIQRDLGTASLFFMFFASIVFVASGRKSLLAIAAILVVSAGLAGYMLFDVVQLRVDAWLNPWLDPSGGSFQIVQSLMAVANGGLVGRGPGLGSPALVPLAHSDLIFAAIAEEFGLIGVIALLLIIGLLAHRGLRAGLLAADAYRSFLAVGLTTYLIGQALLIIAGALRLLPLTGITLPFMAYGGSSLVTSFSALLLLIHISSSSKKTDLAKAENSVFASGTAQAKSFSLLSTFFSLGLIAAALASGWWAVVRAPDLLIRTDNPRRGITDRWVLRGDIYDRNLQLINASSGLPGNYARRTYYPDLSNVVGYTDPAYGQSGLEASMDSFLRGIEGKSALDVWWNHLIYGQPPPGLDIRLSLDLQIQAFVDKQMAQSKGAVVLMDADSGEILAMSSAPTFNANQLSENWQSLVADQNSPLLNRAIQGQYPLGALKQLLIPAGFEAPILDQQPNSYLELGRVAQNLTGYSPLQIAWMASVISNAGLQPVPRLVTGYALAQDDWQVFPVFEAPRRVLTAEQVDQIVSQLDVTQEIFWETVQVIGAKPDSSVTWYVGGTIPGWTGRSLSLAVLLEGSYPEAATEIGQAILKTVIP
jgi:cell division protein FtsW (lipid II flippase)